MLFETGKNARNMNSNFTRRKFIRTASAAAFATATLPSALAQTEKKITLAFVGVAHIHTPGFISLLKTRADVKVKSVWDHDAARVEKPLGITAKESFAMADTIEKAKLLFTTGYFMRADPKHLFLKDEIAKGSFGKITRARGSTCHSGSLAGWFDTE